MGRFAILEPSCNLATVRDGRGGIFTWVPDEPILEFNLLYFRPGATRGLHYHTEFTEYFLVVDGEGVMIVRPQPDDPASEFTVHLAKGRCSRTGPGIMHTVYAITPLSVVAMLTKPWDLCDKPIVQVEQLPRWYGGPAS
jgi:mannose-6-phosphate isomerase-like protein (cupin superfamily)